MTAFLANLELWLLEQVMEQSDPDAWYAQEWEKYQSLFQRVPVLPEMIGTRKQREAAHALRQRCYEEVLWERFLRVHNWGHATQKAFRKDFLACAKDTAEVIAVTSAAFLWTNTIRLRDPDLKEAIHRVVHGRSPIDQDGYALHQAREDGREEQFAALYPEPNAAYAVYVKRELTWLNHASLLENNAEGFGPYDAFLRIKRAYEHPSQSLQKLCYIHEQLYQCRECREEIEDASHEELREWFPTTYIPHSDSRNGHADVQDTVKYSEYLNPSHEAALDFCRRYYDAAIRFLEEIIAELAATQTEKAEG